MHLARKSTPWRLGPRSLALGSRTLVMGVVNITPDSFSDGGSYLDPEPAIQRGLELLAEGADLLDLGAESTRPGASLERISPGEEQERLLPVIEGLRKLRPEAVISADTYRAATAQAALEAGAAIVNDVSGLRWDESMAAVMARFHCGVVLVHTRGRPDEWRGQARLEPDELIELVRTGLAESMARAARAGVDPDSIVLDPGYGFGKKFDENYALLARQSQLLGLERPLLAGLSRKSFLGHTLAGLYGGRPAPVDARENASLAALVAAILGGASIVRVHEVRAAVEAARIADAVLAQGNGGGLPSAATSGAA